MWALRSRRRGEPQAGELVHTLQNLPAAIQFKAAIVSAHRAGQAEFAGVIEKQQEPLTRVVTLSPVPETRPLADGERLPGHDSSNRLVYPERDPDSGYLVRSARLNSFHTEDGSGEDVAGTSGKESGGESRLDDAVLASQ